MTWNDIVVKKALSKFLTCINEEYDFFLEKRSKEWSQKVIAAARNNLSTGGEIDSHDELFLDILKDNELHCRRDVRISQPRFDTQNRRLSDLRTLRDKLGYPSSDSTIVAARAQLNMHRWKFMEADVFLRNAISRNEEMGCINNRMDNVILKTWRTCCLYSTGKFDEAVELADHNLRLALEIPSELEKETYAANATDPENFCPSAVHAYLGACDSRVHHERWHADKELRTDFESLWNETYSIHNAPESWLPYMKIMIFSDIQWVKKLQKHTDLIARFLYIELASNWYEARQRMFRSWWGGMTIDYTKLSRAACVALLVSVVATHQNVDASTTVSGML